MLLTSVAEPNSAKVKAEDAKSDQAVLISGAVRPSLTKFRVDIEGPNITWSGSRTDKPGQAWLRISVAKPGSVRSRGESVGSGLLTPQAENARSGRPEFRGSADEPVCTSSSIGMARSDWAGLLIGISSSKDATPNRNDRRPEQPRPQDESGKPDRHKDLRNRELPGITASSTNSGRPGLDVPATSDAKARRMCERGGNKGSSCRRSSRGKDNSEQLIPNNDVREPLRIEDCSKGERPK